MDTSCNVVDWIPGALYFQISSKYTFYQALGNFTGGYSTEYILWNYKLQGNM